MPNKPTAKRDVTYCVNKKCSQRDRCARYFNNYHMEPNRLYSFCQFEENTCIESEERDEHTGVTRSNKK